MPNDVAILGGGFMGVCAALECAHRGISVDLYDRRSELLTEAGRVNEGKIHVGYVYANDPTEKTTRRLVDGAVLFASCLGRWIDLHANPLETSEPFDYAVLRQSALPVSTIESHFRVVDRILDETEQKHGARYLNRPSAVGFEPLSSEEFERRYDRAHVAAVYRTTERSVDAWRLAERCARLCARLRAFASTPAPPSWASVRDADAGFLVALTSGDAEKRERYRYVVNALWGGRLGIDAGLGFLPRRRWLYRYKFGIRLALRPGAAQPPNGDAGARLIRRRGQLLDRSDLRVVVSSRHGRNQRRHRPSRLGCDVRRAQRRAIACASVQALGTYLKALRDVPEAHVSACHVDGGVIFAWGATDIDDPESELHQRHDIGIRTDGNYHSVDPGKYTMAPMFAVQLGERLVGVDDVTAPLVSVAIPLYRSRHLSIALPGTSRASTTRRSKY
jgi:glycine/D-amino acid oxidase-like deaminating enzyme